MEENTVCSLVYLRKPGQKLGLAIPKGGPCKGLYSSYGGKQEHGETVAECALRELADESGGIQASPDDLLKIGVMIFRWDNEVPGLSRPETRVVEVHIYVLEYWRGYAKATEEMGPLQFFEVDNLPYDQMMPGEERWLRQLGDGHYFTGEYWYKSDGEKTELVDGYLHNPPRADWLAVE